MVSTIQSKVLVLALLFAAALSIFFAGPRLMVMANAECATWETPFSLEVNPYPPNSPGHGAWQAVYGESRVVYANFAMAVANVEGCGGGYSEDTLPSAFMVATPSTIQLGDSAQLNWFSGNVTECTIDQGIGSVAVGPGSRTVSPTQTTTYTISCTGPAGPISASDTVEVTNVPPAPPAVTLVANPASVAFGSPSTLSWTSTNADSCSINQSVGSVSPVGGGSVQVTPGSTTAYTITCTNASGQGTASATVTVTGTTGPDLTASPVSPSSAVINVATSLSSTISNGGGSSTGSGFNNIFQIDSNSDHSSGVTSYMGSVSPTTAAGASYVSSVSRSFTTAGTWYVRACADNNTSMVGTIAETNEANNCSAWTTITVASSGSGAAVACNVDKTTIGIGESVTYTAVPSGGAGAPYAWTDTPDAGVNLGTSNSVTRTYTSAGTYAMQVSASSAGSAGFCSNVVVGTASCPGAASASISAAPNRVRSGNTSTITWSAQNVQGNCTISGPGLNQTVTAASCSVPSTSATVTINAQSVYQIVCTGANASTVVNLLPIIEEF